MRQTQTQGFKCRVCLEGAPRKHLEVRWDEQGARGVVIIGTWSSVHSGISLGPCRATPGGALTHRVRGLGYLSITSLPLWVVGCSWGCELFCALPGETIR